MSEQSRTQPEGERPGQADAAAPPEPSVLTQVRGHLGVITLNRPKAINALTHEMVQLVSRALDAWRDDEAVAQVLITGAGERGLCAGGDIVALYQDALSGDLSASAAFFADEYRMNSQIAHYPKPVIAIQQGIVLGGGIGISAHASHRVVTEDSRLGMPETGIGFGPDVGGTWLLTRDDSELGTLVALTAGMVGAADALAVGLSDYFVPTERIEALTEQLTETPADALLASFAVSDVPLESRAGTAWVGDDRVVPEWINESFQGNDVREIIARLKASSEPRAGEVVAAIESKSPTALAVTLAALRRACDASSLDEVLEQEYRVSLNLMRGPDFAEGVRAQVVDKDRNPSWNPKTLDAIDGESVEAFFAPVDPSFTL